LFLFLIEKLQTRFSDLHFRVRESPKCKSRADYPQIYFRADFIGAVRKTARGLPKTFSRNDFLRVFRPNFLSFFEVIFDDY